MTLQKQREELMAHLGYLASQEVWFPEGYIPKKETTKRVGNNKKHKKRKKQ